MVTAKGYISSKLAKFYLSVTDEELDAHLIEFGLDADDAYTKDNAATINAALIGIVPELLAAPDISEDSFSIKRNPDSIRAYIRFLCDKYGLSSPFPSEDSVFNASNLW